MLEFYKENQNAILRYSSEGVAPHWLYPKLRSSEVVKISKVFNLTKEDLISNIEQYDTLGAVEFKIATLSGDYYCFPKQILNLDNDLYVHKSIELNKKLFIAERGVSIFGKLDNLVSTSIFLGGENENSIPKGVFEKLQRDFPNSYELNKYASARVSSIISSYIELGDDHEEKYQTYMNNKVSLKGADLNSQFAKFEVQKYNSLLEKLNYMLENEIAYSEAQWQKELLQIILLIYPKYIHIFKEAPVRDTYSNTTKSIDYLLVDSSGNIDIIEIKKPFDKCIVTSRTYRDNHIPLRELSGTLMQIEKYLYFLNKWGKKGEDYLTKKYESKLGVNFRIKVTNPSGIIIMGRTDGMSFEQKQDFEIIKRKYKSVIDIITYDDLLERLRYTVQRWTNTSPKS
ncbi:Shedu immune nuclease family protein [Pseudoalteromonas obscura]|uniref:DUF4263 domain-containing protein n=1 Tax=Pseudoalteromonas obscura TaxID=3048491 RepID=A0ABT7EE26_9GAMM|nr:Shedu immune nuclease family protein [Pseudoalteromonas sp. P94(2023)]MDK2593535.1 DUF4263 domain-containing protein [Pseudoalteromonas sp. P94(2023)]